MFQTKPTITTTIMVKSSKLDNVLVNVIATIMTHSQVPKQQVFKECELVKAKRQLTGKLKNKCMIHLSHYQGAIGE
jgi:hypothetical protein